MEFLLVVEVVLVDLVEMQEVQVLLLVLQVFQTLHSFLLQEMVVLELQMKLQEVQ